MITERKDLKVGTTYYMDGRRTEKGVFVERDEDSIYFDCGKDSSYARSNIRGKKHLTPFNVKGAGFEEVELLTSAVVWYNII